MEIKNVNKEQLPECLEVIHKSFATVAEEFGLTIENCPKHTSFMPLYFLESQMEWGWNMFGLFDGEIIIGYMSISKEDDNIYELHNLAISPEHRHKGYGSKMIEYAKDVVKTLGSTKIKIGIIDESDILKKWYISHGFDYIGNKKFDHLPFKSGYLEWESKNENT